MPGTAARLVLALAIVSTLGCDRVTKHVAATRLAGEPAQSYVGDMLRLEYAENTGGFLSLGTELPDRTRSLVFTVFTGLALLALAVFAARGERADTRTLALALFVTGGVSNWIDRVLHGVVVDFINMGVGSVRTGVFNVADIAITVGAVLFLAVELRRYRAATIGAKDDGPHG